MTKAGKCVPRLDIEERGALEKALSRVSGKVYLFGSRLNPNVRGGDIDILVFSDRDAYRLSKGISTTFFKNCEEKVDVVVMDPKKMTREQKAFVKTLKMERLK